VRALVLKGSGTNFALNFYGNPSTATCIASTAMSTGGDMDLFEFHGAVPSVWATSQIAHSGLNVGFIASGSGYFVAEIEVEEITALEYARRKIQTSAGVPATTPDVIGQDLLDTTNNKWYKAKGVASSADWLLLN
jgi:hypothetical protein